MTEKGLDYRHGLGEGHWNSENERIKNMVLEGPPIYNCTLHCSSLHHNVWMLLTECTSMHCTPMWPPWCPKLDVVYVDFLCSHMTLPGIAILFF